jgi:DNA-binding transcriptional MerR regulator
MTRYSSAEVAGMLGVHPRRVLRWAEEVIRPEIVEGAGRGAYSWTEREVREARLIRNLTDLGLTLEKIVAVIETLRDRQDDLEGPVFLEVYAGAERLPKPGFGVTARKRDAAQIRLPLAS